MTILTLAPVRDTYITAGGTPTFNYGASPTLQTSGPASTAKAMLYFNFSAIPVGAIINSATLTLTCFTGGTGVNVTTQRALTTWFEGNANGGSSSTNGSTWQMRDQFASAAWGSSTAGGLAGTDYSNSIISTISVAAANVYNWPMTAEVNEMVNQGVTNFGWWLIQATGALREFRSNAYGVAADRPKLVIDYRIPGLATPNPAYAVSSRLGPAVGRSSMAVAPATGFARGETVLLTVLAGYLITPPPAVAQAERVNPNVGIGGLTFLGQADSARGETAAPSVAIAAQLVASASTAVAVTLGPTAVIKGSVVLTPPAAAARGGVFGPASLVDLALRPAAATAYVRTLGRTVAYRIFAEVCTPDPLLYITDGTQRPNGQMSRLNLIDANLGFILKDWKPNIAQYKGNGVFSESAIANGRRLVRRQFANAIEIMDLAAKGHSQDSLIAFIRELFAWQEMAADYWVSDWAQRPVYLVAKAARETETRYALVHTMSVPELQNPYAQSFYDSHAVSRLDSITLRIERNDWTSTPPGVADCVPVSGLRSWTVTGWVPGNTTGGGGGTPADTITGNILALVQANNGDILAGTNDQGKIYRSTNNGQSWLQVAKLGSGTDAINAFAKTSTGNLFAATTGTIKGVWKSVNNGVSWTKVYTATGTGYFDITYTVQQSFLTAGGGNQTATAFEANTLIMSNDEGVTWYTPSNLPTQYGVKAVAGQQEPILSSQYPGQPAGSLFNKANATFVGYNVYYTLAGVVALTDNIHAYQTETPASGQMGNLGLDMVTFIHQNSSGSYYKKALWAVRSAANVNDTEIWQWPNPAGGFTFGKLATITTRNFNVLYVDPVAWQNIPVARTVWAGTNGEIWVSYDNGLTWAVATTAPVNQVRALLRTSAGTLIAGCDAGEIFIYSGGSGSQGGGQGGSSDSAPPVSSGGSTAVVNTYPLGRSETCDDEVYIANGSTFSNITHVFHYDGAAYTNLQFSTIPPYALLGAVAVVNKAAYFGSQTSDPNVPGGTFTSLIFDITRYAENMTVVWEFWNGSAWATLTVRDTTSGFRLGDVGSVHWTIPPTWVVTAVNGITGYWVRVRTTVVNANAVTPLHDHRYVYTPNLPYGEMSQEAVEGDLPAAAQIRWHNRADDPLEAGGLGLEADRIICGLRSVQRGTYFNPYLNVSDTQIPFGFTVIKGSAGTWINSLRAPTNRAFDIVSGATLNTWMDLVTFSISNTVARDYYGTYRAFLRGYRYGAGTDYWQVRLRTSFGSGGSVSDSRAVQVAGGDWELIDLGQITVPTTQVSPLSGNLGDMLKLTIQGYAPVASIQIDLYDLILIPTDEWAVDAMTPTPSGSMSPSKIMGDFYLDLDSITNPKNLITATNRNYSDLIVARYQAITNGPAMLQARRQQRLWFVASSFYNNWWRSFPEIVGSIQVYKQQRYLAYRGTS